VNELADATFTHQSTVSVVVGRLVRDGLVARRPARKDGRRIELSLTPKGWRAYERSPRAAQNEVARAIQSLPAAKRRAFGKTFHDLMSEAGFAVSKPPLFFEETPKGKGNRP
jgi:DNA-binding MarR family transcriptional regulator